MSASELRQNVFWMENLSKQTLGFGESACSIKKKKSDQNIPEQFYCEVLFMFDQHFESLPIEV